MSAVLPWKLGDLSFHLVKVQGPRARKAARVSSVQVLTRGADQGPQGLQHTESKELGGVSSGLCQPGTRRPSGPLDCTCGCFEFLPGLGNVQWS